MADNVLMYECFFLFFLAFLAQLTRPDSFVILIPIAFLSYWYNSNRSQSLFNHLYLKPLSVCTGLLLAFCFVSIGWSDSLELFWTRYKHGDELIAFLCRNGEESGYGETSNCLFTGSICICAVLH